MPECSLKAVCDLSEKRLKHMHSLYPEVAGETDFNRLVEDPEIDALVIATSARTHYPMAKATLMAGKHVLIEKPMACSTAECEELIALAKQQGKVVMVGHTFRIRRPCER
jgi:predicted dehydrogenase